MQPSTRCRLATFSSRAPPISSLLRRSAGFTTDRFPSPRRNRACKSAAKLKRWPPMTAALMFGGVRSGLLNFSKAVACPNPSLPFRSTLPPPPPPPKPNRLSIQCARRSSQADSNASDYGDVKGKDSMKEYVNKAEEAAEKAKEETEEEAEKAKEKTKEGADAARDKASGAAAKTRETMKEGVEQTKETAQAAKEKSKSMAEEGAERSKEGASKVAETAQSMGEKAKQTVQGAWEAAKETTHKIKETVVGKDEEEDAKTNKEGRDKV